MSETKKNERKTVAGKTDGLAGGRVKSEVKARAARINGAKGGHPGGSGKSEAKTVAARANGVKGGRPKGTPNATADAKKAAVARAASLTPERRREIAQKAVAAREAKRKKD